MKSSKNILIHGAGPTGSMLAISLASIGFRTTLVDISQKLEIMSRSRAYAITHSSRILLQKLDLWDEIKEILHPFNNLSIIDDVLSYQLTLNTNDLNIRNRHHSSLGWILDHRELMEILFRRIELNDNITESIGDIKLYNEADFDMQIAANGPLSIHRKEWGFSNLSHCYSSGCLTAKVLIRGSASNKAFEIFRKEGPLAVLPMKNNIFQIVWTAPLAKCKSLSKLKHSLFLDQLASILPDALQPDLLVDRLSFFPINLSIAYPFFFRRFILVGESAHRCHPVGGQGLNICWRDIYYLTKGLKDYREGKRTYRFTMLIYSINRYIDVLFISMITHLLVSIYSGKNIFLLVFRYPFLRIARKYRFVREFMMKVMSEGLFPL